MPIRIGWTNRPQDSNRLSAEVKIDVGYHTRSLVETTMQRFKSAFGDKLKGRTPPNQKVEARLPYNILNQFTQLGMPDFAWS